MATAFTIDDAVFDLFPQVVVGVLVGRGLDNRGAPPAIGDVLAAAEATARDRMGDTPPRAHPHIAAWREAYSRFGAKPSKYLSSIESLVKRAGAGPLRRINPIVDLYNAVSLLCVTPVGAEDLDRIDGHVRLIVAGPNEPPVRMLGEADDRPPNPGEIIYTDDTGAICRRWNWKEAERTKLTPASTNIMLVIEGLPPVDRVIVGEALEMAARLLRQHCGGDLTTMILSSSTRSVVLG